MSSSASSHDTHAELTGQLAVWHQLAYAYLTPLLLTTGILTNLLNITVLHQRLCTTSNSTAVRGIRYKNQQQQRVTVFRYLSGLAVSQLLACISLIPSILHIDRTSLSYSWAFYYAHFEILLMNTPTASCVYILVGLSVDRYVAACRPSSYRRVSSPKMATMRIASSLILPLLFYIPHCFLAEAGCNDQGTGWTVKSNGTEEHAAWKVWAWIVELCHRLLPSLFIVFFNAKVIIKVRKVNRQFRDRNPNRQVSQESSGKIKITASKTNSMESSSKALSNVHIQDGDDDASQPLAQPHSFHTNGSDQNEIQPSPKNLPVSAQKPPIKDNLRCASKDSIKNAKARNSNREQLERQLANLLLAIIVVFLVTTLPAALLALSDSSDSKFESFGYEIFRAVANLTELVGFSVNFVLYFIFVREFQDWLHLVCRSRGQHASCHSRAHDGSCHSKDEECYNSPSCSH